MRSCIAILMLVALVGCDKSSDITLLDNSASLTTQATVLAEDPWLLSSFPGVFISDDPDKMFEAETAPDFLRISSSSGFSYSNGLWMAIGGPSPFGGAQIWASSDGQIWEPRYFSEFGDSSPVALASFDNGTWVAVTSQNNEFIEGKSRVLEFAGRGLLEPMRVDARSVPGSKAHSIRISWCNDGRIVQSGGIFRTIIIRYGVGVVGFFGFGSKLGVDSNRGRPASYSQDW